MHIQFIAASALAAAVVLNPATVFADEHEQNIPARTDSGSETNHTILGRLVSLPEYLSKRDSTASTGLPTSPRNPERPDGTRPNPPQALQKNPYELPSATQPNARFNPMNPASSHTQTLLLISQNMAIQDTATVPAVQIPTTGSAGRTFTGQSEPKPASDPATRSDRDATSVGGQVYILVFGEDSSSQAALLKAKAMIADGNSNWATSADEARDRLQVRGVDDTDRNARREASRPRQTDETTLPGQRETSRNGLKDDAQMRVTGRLMRRGGIQAIQVSDISMESRPMDPTSAKSGDVNRDRLKVKEDRKPE